LPISTLGSYLPALQEFGAHWAQANVALGGSEVVLRGGYSLAQFTADREALTNAFQSANSATLDAGFAASMRDRKKAALQPRLIQFRAVVLGQYGDAIEARELPLSPSFTLAESKFLQPFDQMALLWQKLSAQTEITLIGGYTLANFQAELADVRVAYSNATLAAMEAKLARERRDVLLEPLRQRLKQYRLVIPGLFPANHPIVATLPVLTPPPGATPDAVGLTGAWDRAAQVAILSWDASDNKRLDHYSVRACIGETYKVTEEAVLGTVLAGVQTFRTNEGFAGVGAALSLKVYVVTRDGNERGSNAVKVVRAS
jgi:hypothetical protein